MSVVVLIPPALQKFTNNQAKFECDAESVGDLIGVLEDKCPGIKSRICNESGQIRQFINFYVNSEDIRLLSREQTKLQSGDEVSIVPAVAGG
ncbi:MAG: MoaD/ThiS family protein [Cyanobacteriota bacterium ELA615]|jgi:molybdopterin converting factor small subunit